MKKLKIKIGDLFSKLNINETVNTETVNVNNKEIYVKTPSGSLTKINAFIKKPKQNTIKVKFNNGESTICSPKHIFINEHGDNVFAKDAKQIKTINSVISVSSRVDIEDQELYDIAIDTPHLYVGANGIIHHNSKLSTLAIKHALNNTDKLPYDKLEDNPSLDNQHVNIVFVKSTDVLVMDKFWRNLENAQADIVIIDDLDYMLTKRDSEVQSQDDVNKNAFLNQFLSYTDGVEKHKTKFIITTNQSYSDIDSALLRKGRLFDILELRKLDHKEAEDIWLENKLPKDVFNELFKTHEILPAELGSEINKRLNSRIETAVEPYLKEEGISKIERASRSKKISL